jgi:hypothetical protein
VEAEESESQVEEADHSGKEPGTSAGSQGRPEVSEPRGQHGCGPRTPAPDDDRTHAPQEDLQAASSPMTIDETLRILADGAKYDASCSSSRVVRRNSRGGLGNSDGTGICHSSTADGRCVSLLKILLTNYCIRGDS